MAGPSYMLPSEHAARLDAVLLQLDTWARIRSQDVIGLDVSWMSLAACVGADPDLFFPLRGASTREAKEVCYSCVVRAECLEYALASNAKHGIWGGCSERERRSIRQRRRREGASALHTESDAEEPAEVQA